jgi:hypothetical protein
MAAVSLMGAILLLTRDIAENFSNLRPLALQRRRANRDMPQSAASICINPASRHRPGHRSSSGCNLQPMPSVFQIRQAVVAALD